MRAAPATFGISITSCSTSRTSALIRLSGNNSTHKTRTKKARNWAKMERVGNEQRTRKRGVSFIGARERFIKVVIIIIIIIIIITMMMMIREG
jgi:hypothetical protein